MNSWMLLALFTILFSATATPAQADRAGIEHAQTVLKEKGHDPGRIDGLMGPQTIAALRAYQKEEGLSATGRLDDATLARLGRPKKGSGAEPRPGQSSTQTGGDTKPSAVDPAQAGKTGANVGEGASYSRSTEKGESTMKR